MAKKIRNLIGTLLLITAVIITQIPVADVEAEETASTSDFQMDGTTLVKYNGTAEDVSVSNYVEKIEAEAFAGNSSIKHVTIGIAVESIGSRAFAECPNLVSVTVPDSVITIEEGAFAGCPMLSKVTVGTGLKKLGNGAFAGDYNLQTVDISSSNPFFTCDDGAIYHKKGRDILYQVLAGRRGESYTVPDSVKQIRPYAFWGDLRLKNVRLGDNVSEIPGHALSNCKNLKDVEISYAVKQIDMKAFENCIRLREITIPPSVNKIHSTAFDGCTMLTIHAKEGSVADEFAQSLVLEDIDVSEYEEIPGTVLEMVNDDDSDEDMDVDYYHEVTHMDPIEDAENEDVAGVTRVIGSQAFVLIDNATATVNVGSTGEKLGGTKEEPVIEKDTVPGLAEMDVKTGLFPKFTVVNDEAIAAQAYYGSEMSSFSIPSGIESIGDFAFARSKLESFSIPDGTRTIGYAAFYHCDELSDISIPLSVNHIEPAAFQNTLWLENWQEGNGGDGDFLIVGDGILLSYRGSEKQLVIPDGVKQIGSEAFKDNATIEEVMIPDSVFCIGEAAFENCASLKKVSGMEYVSDIRDRAFSGCPLEGILLSENNVSIGLRAFDSTNSAKAAEDRVVVFQGTQFPKLSYRNSATKLYREKYRDLAFKGTEIAVVNTKFPKTEDSILDVNIPGFEGTICYIGKEATEDEAGVLIPITRHGGNSVKGKTYNISGLPYVVESAAISEKMTRDRGNDNGEVSVRVKSNTINTDAGVQAVMDGANHDYELSIKDSASAKNTIGDAYKELFGKKRPGNLKGFDITLTEKSSDIPITSLGKQEAVITMPIPSGIGKENVFVVCLDQDGQLENVESSITEQDGVAKITFHAKHFSQYGIYSLADESGNTARIQNGKAVFTTLGQN